VPDVRVFERLELGVRRRAVDERLAVHDHRAARNGVTALALEVAREPLEDRRVVVDLDRPCAIPRQIDRDRAPSRVVIVPVTAAVWSDGENVKSAGPLPMSLTKFPSQSRKLRIRTVRKSRSIVVSPFSASSS
jgi:hypothetical protein